MRPQFDVQLRQKIIHGLRASFSLLVIVRYIITSGLEELHAISLASYSPLQLDQHALVCAVPLQRPPVTLHLGCAQLLENWRFFPVRRSGTLFMHTFAPSGAILIFFKNSWKLISFSWLLTSSNYFICCLRVYVLPHHRFFSFSFALCDLIFAVYSTCVLTQL